MTSRSRWWESWRTERAAARARLPVVPGPRWLIGCVADEDPRFTRQALAFVQSLRWFGGSLAAARVRVCFVGGATPERAAPFLALGAEVRAVPRFHARNPFANKLQFFAADDWAGVDQFLLCDCDTLIVQDPAPHLRGDAFQAKIADLPTVTTAVFQRLFRHFGLPMPAAAFTTDFDPTPTIPYFNSGVVVVPGAIGKRLVGAWRDVNRHLADRLEMLGPCARHVNQAALALALAIVRAPARALDRALNFPVHLTDRTPPAGFAACDPVIVHYHERAAATGEVWEPPYPAAAARIRTFNQRRAAPRDHAARRWRDAGGGRDAHGGRDARGGRDVVVTGISRSGTSYLCRMLHRFDDCVAVNEPAELVRILAGERVPAGVAALFADVRRRIVAGEPIANKLDGDDVVDDTAVENAARLYRPRPASRDFVLALKNTRAVLSRLGAVRDAMPEARLVACVRNPLDTLGSWKRSFPHLREAALTTVPVGHPEDPWLAEPERESLRRIAAVVDVAERRARWWCWFAERLVRYRSELALVRYPELVRDPAAAIARALPGCPLGAVRVPLAASSARRSRVHLEPHEVEVTRAICGPLARELGVDEPE